MKYLCLSIIMFCLFFGVRAQSAGEVLLTIDGAPYYADEFLWFYNKNGQQTQDQKDTDIDEQIRNYIDFKLKVLEAKEIGLDKKESYIREFQKFRKQLSKNYLTDTIVTNRLLQQAYDRSRKEINASHILIRLDQKATPEDTLRVFNRLKELRKEALENDFDSVRKKVHDGQSVFGEELGYFSVFRMVYPFEEMAYGTEVGDISEPFRTRFGYHILRVNDVRDHRGEVEVRQIMAKYSEEEDSIYPAGKRIQDIYRKIQDGVDFELLARQYSDDRESAALGGRLPAFKSGKNNLKNFEDVSFSLEEGEVSKPFQTRYGWHIVKVIRKTPIGSYEEEKPGLETRLRRDQRSQKITEGFLDGLKKRFGFKEYEDVKEEVLASVNEEFLNRNWFKKYLGASLLNKTLYTIEDTEIKADHFAEHLYRAQFRINSKDLKKVLSELYERYLNDQLLQYYEEHLEEINREFAHIVGEYRDGLLLFEILQREILQKSETESKERRDFYEENKENYLWDRRIKVVIASTRNTELASKIEGLFGQNKTIEEINTLLNNKEKSILLFNEGVFEISDKRLPASYDPVKGISNTKEKDHYYVIRTLEVMEPGPKAYEEVRGRVINDYQEKLQKEWLLELRKKHSVEIDKKVLKRVKKELTK
ncbi:peptidylprolyl isomerase [Leptobacterium flavescens]|uniref:Peptidylprolyl isomerase n=1 Tax=Leptobacterium flavescens TaxID=472055 RepID=A0A6P0UQX7_9FLAO|nr:peptidylprolyl isomerase [Leptobacterium flavescens]NER15535.1 peptidylprolyl isomerase [Leptobacterium flavescens]